MRLIQIVWLKKLLLTCSTQFGLPELLTSFECMWEDIPRGPAKIKSDRLGDTSRIAVTLNEGTGGNQPRGQGTGSFDVRK